MTNTGTACSIDVGFEPLGNDDKDHSIHELRHGFFL